jgi:hypothetical protein
MVTIDVNRILNTVYGVRGLPFPQKVNTNTGTPIGAAFSAPVQEQKERTAKGTPLWNKNNLGAPVFMPAWINGVEIPNPLITITGEKSIVETDVVDVGTVFERIFQRPFDITIIATLISVDNSFPEEQLRNMLDIWKQDEAVTLECAYTDMVLIKELGYRAGNNFVITKIDLLDMQGVENAQVVQITGRSNIDFELELK